MTLDREVELEFYQLLIKIPPERLETAMADLAFEWRDPHKLSKGQLKVVMKRLRRAAIKRLEDYDRDAANSELIVSMRESLGKFRRGLYNG